MRLATWNVNSIRARVDRVTAFLDRHDVDVLAIQETKCRDDQFPHLLFEAAGYQVAHVGLNQWNGVAIASRVGLEDVQVGFDGMPAWGDPAGAEARAISAVCGGVRVVSLYVPNGRSLDDPHMAYKLDWLGRLRTYAAARLVAAPDEPAVLMGDWNIAPEDEDVWSMAFYENKTHVSAPERAAFRAVLEAGFTDVVRPFTPGPGVYTYWDYTQLRFPKRQGMRIDFALGSPAFAARVSGAFIDREERKGKGASDHAPVVVDVTD
ncbi:exodeoxyribonuclease III [Ornithinimicrobium cavernae]|uniref:exodeoxyribonuclease III n=1 Tax=Ornithinimicrobium cavernae TaxID=2666047 RepID=UPI000D68F6D6|nr:exodeoxyribonuclease III [Ornithinimicrobium cavernae]